MLTAADDCQPSHAEALASLEALPAVAELTSDLPSEALACLLLAWTALANMASTCLEQHDELEGYQALKPEDFKALQQHLRWPMQALRKYCKMPKPAFLTKKTGHNAAAVCADSATERDIRLMQVSGSCAPLELSSALKATAADADLPQQPDAVLHGAVDLQGQNSASIAAARSSENCTANAQQRQPGGPVGRGYASGKHETSLDLSRSSGPALESAIKATASSESKMEADPHGEAQHERLHQHLEFTMQQWQNSYRCASVCFGNFRALFAWHCRGHTICPQIDRASRRHGLLSNVRCHSCAVWMPTFLKNLGSLRFWAHLVKMSMVLAAQAVPV